jgi:hypothetical protein
MTSDTKQPAFFSTAAGQLTLLAAIVVAIFIVGWRYVF